MKTLGMIGGTSWHSTIVYYRLINEMVGNEIGTQANPPLLLYSLNVALMREGDWDRIARTYAEIGQTLEAAGAEGLIICANTPHKIANNLISNINIPLLHIADATARSAVAQGFGTVGLLGTLPTMEGDFLTSRFKDTYQLETITPDAGAREETHRLIADEMTQGNFSDTAKQFILQEMANLMERGADGIVLGCTELPMLIGPEVTNIPLLDTTTLHAEMAMKFILS